MLSMPTKRAGGKVAPSILQNVPDEELSHLAKLIRERRKKAKDQAHQRRREMRGKELPAALLRPRQMKVLI